MKTRYLLVIMLFLIAAGGVRASAYQLSWPGMLPDHPLYKIKQARNKLIEKMLYSPVKRVEYDLLMADKLLYASRLLLDKGEHVFARETALKGENYFSILVSDAKSADTSKLMIPDELKGKIEQAYAAHQELIVGLIADAREEDKETYRQVQYFSQTNYEAFTNKD